MSSSSSFSLPSSSSIGEENGNPPPTSMLLGFQQLEEERIIATTTCTHTQLPVVPSIMDIIGCDITIDDIQLVKQELLNKGFDLKMDVNKSQELSAYLPGYTTTWEVTPLIHFCGTGNLLIIKLLFLIGADCTKSCKYGYRFPMLAAARGGHLDTCKWLFEYGGDAKYQINKEANSGYTPLSESYREWRSGDDNGARTCRWLLRNGGGQHLSSKAMGCLRINGKWETNSNLLVLWMRENMQLHDTFLLILCGATTMNTSSSSLSSSGSNEGGTRKHKCTQKIHREQSLQILDGHPGIMELIGDYVGLIRGKELRMLKEFNESVIAYNNTYQSSCDDDDDDDDESSCDNDNDYDNGEGKDEDGDEE